MQRENGIVIGIVADLDDQEELGRVRVRFPHLNDQMSDWARLATPMGARSAVCFSARKKKTKSSSHSNTAIRGAHTSSAAFGANPTRPRATTASGSKTTGGSSDRALATSSSLTIPAAPSGLRSSARVGSTRS